MKTLFSAAVVLIVLACGRPTCAQTPPASDKWTVVFTPYLLGSAVGGIVTVKGHEADIDVPVSTLLKNLKAGFMGALVARKGQWGVGTDLIWARMGATKSIATLDFDEGMYAFYGLRRLSTFADLTFGVRVNQLKTTMNLSGPLAFSGSENKTWVDPLVGLDLRTPERHHLVLRVYSEIGGFGAGSKFEWQVFPVVAITITKRMSLDVGYRWLDVDYSSGAGGDLFVWNTLTQGPVMGFSFKF